MKMDEFFQRIQALERELQRVRKLYDHRIRHSPSQHPPSSSSRPLQQLSQSGFPSLSRSSSLSRRHHRDQLADMADMSNTHLAPRRAANSLPHAATLPPSSDRYREVASGSPWSSKSTSTDGSASSTNESQPAWWSPPSRRSHGISHSSMVSPYPRPSSPSLPVGSRNQDVKSSKGPGRKGRREHHMSQSARSLRRITANARGQRAMWYHRAPLTHVTTRE